MLRALHRPGRRLRPRLRHAAAADVRSSLQSSRPSDRRQRRRWLPGGKAATPATWKAVAKKFNDAGIDLALLCYNMQDSMKDEDIEYGFRMAKGLGVKGITTSTTLTMAKRIAPIADSTSCWWDIMGDADQRCQPDGDPGKLRNPDGIREIQRRQPRYRPLHGGRI